jgi:5-formyltetrahydrofolate cyclo-ligase
MQRDLQSRTRTATLHETKRALRARILAARDAWPLTARREADHLISMHVASLESFQRARTLLITLNFGSEVSTLEIGAAALATGRRLLVPRVNAATKMLDLFRISDLARDVEAGAWGIPEPAPSRCAPASPEEIDWVLVPGIAFDPHGGRLGYGGGYYDRLLPLLPAGAARVAVAYALQVVERVPQGRHDLRVETLITEQGRVPVQPESPS